MKKNWRAMVIFACSWLGLAQAAIEPAVVTVEQPYVDIFTGPGEGFPVFTVVERGNRILVLATQGEWYKIQTERREVGWVAGTSIATEIVNFAPRTNFYQQEHERNAERHFVLGVKSGVLGRDLMYGLSGSYHILHGLHIALSYAEASGLYAMASTLSGGLQWYWWPEHRFTPGIFFNAGQMQGDLHATLVPSKPVRSNFVSSGFSIRARITERLFAHSGLGYYSLQQAAGSLPNMWEWQFGAEIYF